MCEKKYLMKKKFNLDNPFLIKAKAIELLASGETYIQAAKEVGVTRVTLWNWRQDEDFAAALQERKESVKQELEEVLRDAGPLSVKTLLAIMLGPSSDASKLKAAETLLRYQNTIKANSAPEITVNSDIDEEYFERLMERFAVEEDGDSNGR